MSLSSLRLHLRLSRDSNLEGMKTIPLKWGGLIYRDSFPERNPLPTTAIALCLCTGRVRSFEEPGLQHWCTVCVTCCAFTWVGRLLLLLLLLQR